MSGWFPTGEDDSSGWRLDIVSLLAVIGESSMEEHSQAITASWVCILPRIIPAPQALLKPARPTRLPSVNASVFGIYNGNKFEQLNYFPNLIHPVNELPPFAFQVYKIARNCKNKRVQTFKKFDEEQGHAAESTHKSSKFAAIRRNSPFHDANHIKVPPHVPARTWSPLNMLNIFSFVLTIGLFIWALLIRDGVACLALFTISLATSVVGLASKWTPTLMKRNSTSEKLPPGDVVIRTREGAIIVVKCDETVARELYNGTEECEYVIGPKLYRGLLGVGTFLVMLSVILLGNCNWAMQAAIGIAYVVLNGLFWAAALIPKATTWDLSMYEVDEITPNYALTAEAEDDQRPDDPEGQPSFTRTLWYAIRETGKVGWVYRTGAAPKTKKWDQWLAMAHENAKSGNTTWRAVQAKNDIFRGDELEESRDWNEQVVPFQEKAPASIPLPQDTK